MSILGKIRSVIEGSSFGKVVSTLTDKKTYSNAFKTTPLGNLIGGGKGEYSGDAEKLGGSSAGSLNINKETLNFLKSIDDKLKTLVVDLEDTKDALEESNLEDITPSELAGDVADGDSNKVIDKPVSNMTGDSNISAKPVSDVISGSSNKIDAIAIAPSNSVGGLASSIMGNDDKAQKDDKAIPLSGPVSDVMGSNDKVKKDDSKSDDAEKISGSFASNVVVSKETLDSLQAIDGKLKTLINFLEDKKDADKQQKQKAAAAAEEQKTESKVIDAEPMKTAGEGGGGGGMLKQFGKLAGMVAIIVAQFAYPLYKAVMNLKDKFIEGFTTAKDFFVEKILPIFTKDIPEFFTETIPKFFTETLPEKFFAGMNWISEKFSSIADLFTGTVAGIKKKIGEFIVGLSETTIFKLFPETQKKVKSFGEDLIKSGNTTIDEISARQKQSASDAQAQTSAMVEAQPNAAPDKASVQSKDSTKSKLTPFEKEFAKQRNIQGPGGVFSWTDPATGKTGKYTTDYAEENAASPVSKITIENNGQLGKEYGSAPSSDTVDTSKLPTPSSTDNSTSGSSSAAAPVNSTTTLNIPSSGGSGGGSSGGSSGTAEPSSPTSGNAVSAASMQATAPTPTPSAVAQQNSKGMNMSKAKSDDVNPVANVPEVDVDLGSIANLWYHRAAV